MFVSISVNIKVLHIYVNRPLSEKSELKGPLTFFKSVYWLYFNAGAKVHTQQ